MNKKTKIIVYVLLALIVAIQFVPVKLPENKPGSDNDLMVAETIPEDIAIILSNACYDCHSTQVRYPWYSHIAPVKWLVVRDINLGVADLNFSEWDAMTKRQKLKSLDQIADDVKSGTMPYPIFKIMHPEARLTDDQVNDIVTWTDDLIEKIFEE